MRAARNVHGYEVLWPWHCVIRGLSSICSCLVLCGGFGYLIVLSYVLNCYSIALYYELYQPNCAGLRLRFALSGLRCMAPPYGLRRQHSCEPRPTWLRFVRLLLVCALLCWTWPPGLRCLVGAVWRRPTVCAANTAAGRALICTRAAF